MKPKTKMVDHENYTLYYMQYVDDWGNLVDIYELHETKNDGSITVYPYSIPLSVKDYSRDSDVFNFVNEPTKEQMVAFLKEKIETLPNNL